MGAEQTKKDIDRLVKGIREKFAPKKIILFGSQAKNNPSSKSDIDLCVVEEKLNSILLRIFIKIFYRAKSGE